MTHEQIERLVERETDALDRQLMNRALSQAEYDQLINDLDRRAERLFGWNPERAS